MTAEARSLASEESANTGLSSDGTFRSQLEIGMPLTGQNNLAESPLLQQLLHIRWMHLTRILGAPSRDWTDEAGDRLYATVFYVELGFPPERPLSAYRENDRLWIASTLRQFSGFLDGEHYITACDDRTSSATAPQSIEQARALGIPYVRMANALVKKWDGAAWLKRANPSSLGFMRIPHAGEPDFVAQIAAAKNGARYIDPPADHVAIAEGVVEGHEIIPERDINGVGLLYFANYTVITDICERKVLMRRCAGDAMSDALASRSVVRRKCSYHSNATARDSLRVECTITAGPIAKRGLVYEREFLFNSRMRRESDDRLMFVSSSLKRVSHRQPGALGPQLGALAADRVVERNEAR
jgi:probable biosynthetic protein (TIGR04098 family)